MHDGEVIDFSVAQLGSAQIKSQGAVGVVRYLSVAGTRPLFNEQKRIKPPEYNEHLAWGLSIALVMQVDKVDYLQGYAWGHQLGQASLQQSRALGHPDACGVYLAVQDAGIPRNNYGLAVDHMRGYTDGRGLGPQPAYCGTDLGNYLVGAGVASWLWQPVSESWSTSASPHVRLKQLRSQTYSLPGAYDEDKVLHPDWGQNPRPNILPPPNPGTVTEEEAMLWVRWIGETQDVAFGATGWRYITATQRDELRFAKLLRDGNAPGYPQNLPLDWKARYPQLV